ncbi:MAG: hypothetical protein QNL90_21980, partial [Gammaproteobacteria bacterium]|nr:hypothetical protein [Gammaproteobacteria bacterium]MDX2462820.1 hypothetical protein [Gammaproteobacteria bacterium]
DDESSSIEHCLRMRYLEPQPPRKETPEPARATDGDERRKAKDALDRAREHVQRLKNRHDED